MPRLPDPKKGLIERHRTFKSIQDGCLRDILRQRVTQRLFSPGDHHHQPTDGSGPPVPGSLSDPCKQITDRRFGAKEPLEHHASVTDTTTLPKNDHDIAIKYYNFLSVGSAWGWHNVRKGHTLVQIRGMMGKERTYNVRTTDNGLVSNTRSEPATASLRVDSKP